MSGLSGERIGPCPCPSLGHHNRNRNPLKSSDSYDSSEDMHHHFEMCFEFDKAKMSFSVLGIQENVILIKDNENSCSCE